MKILKIGETCSIQRMWSVNPNYFLLLLVMLLLTFILLFSTCYSSSSTVSKLDGGYYLIKDKSLVFNYHEMYYRQANDGHLSYRLFDKTRNTLAGVDEQGVEIVAGSPFLQVAYGHNTLSLPLNGLGLNNNEYYLLEVTSIKEKKYYLRFKLE